MAFTFSLVAYAFATWLIYLVGLTVYRLYFHPLAKFPGPKYAAISRWHEVYHDIYLQGQFIHWMEAQHKKYGPIVRIAPDELHVMDPEFWDVIFTKAGRVDKYEWTSGRFGNESSIFTTSSDSLHRLRRTPLNPFFSRQRIIDLQDVVRGKLDILIRRVEEFQRIQAPMTISRGYMAFSEDVIMRYCFGLDYNSLEKPGWTPILNDVFHNICLATYTAVHFPIVPRIMNALPQAWVEKMDSLYGLIFQMQNDLAKQIRVLKENKSNGHKAGAQNATVFSDLIEGDLPESEKTDLRLQHEAQTVLAGGLATTAWALSVGTFHVLHNPKILAALRTELEQAIPDGKLHNTAQLEWTELEKLPYLTGVIKESIRLSYGVTARNVRLLPKPIHYNDWVIPTRTPISTTVPHLYHDEEIYPDSHSFVPERWLNSPKTSNGSSLDRYFFSFGKGTRSCLGLNLAWCELYLAFAAMFRFFEYELYETDRSDVDLKHDMVLPMPKLDTKGVRVMVKPQSE